MYTALLVVLLLCTASSGAPLPPEAQHRLDFAQGIYIITAYYRSRPNELVNPHTSITNAQFEVISKTCQLLSLRQFVQDTHPMSALLNATLTHGCYHIRDMLGEQEAPTATGAPAGTQTTDSCSQLQYLHTACASAPELINVVANQTAKEIFVEYQRDEGFNICKWVRDNLPQSIVSTVFSICQRK